MTEFVIGLPIFVMIFAGMGMLYKYNHEGLVARMKVAKNLSDNTTAPNLTGIIPVVGAATSIGSWGDVYQNGLSGLGMYYDSWGKAALPNMLIPGAIEAPANPPVRTIDQITGISSGGPNFTNDLLNDLVNPTFDTSGWASTVMSLVSTTGVAPAIAAGIRYGAVEGEAQHSFSHPWTGSVQYDPGKLDMPAPTAATHRLAAVALTRVEMNTEQPYQSSILEFNIDFDMSGSSGAQSATQMGEEATQCGNQATQWQQCLDDADAAGLTGSIKEMACEDKEPDDSCEDLAGDQMKFDTNWCGAGCGRPSK